MSEQTISRIKAAADNWRAKQVAYYASTDPDRHRFDRQWGDLSFAEMILQHTIDLAADHPEIDCPCDSCSAFFATSKVA